MIQSILVRYMLCQKSIRLNVYTKERIMETGLLDILENLMVGVAFAERNEHEAALQMMAPKKDNKKSLPAWKELNKHQEKRFQMRL